MAEHSTTTSPGPRQSLLGRAKQRGKARAERKSERRTARRERRAGPQTPTTEERIEPVVEATQTLADVGQESIEKEQEVADINVQAARDKEAEMDIGQEGTQAKFDEADTAAQEGLTGIQDEIRDTRDLVADLPTSVQTAFADAKVDLDASFDAARTGLEGKSTEALANVMTGRSSAMEAATASIHGATREQMSKIDAQVQQGTLSPSQATAMKAKIRMGASMQLSEAVGQTTALFTKMQADVSTSFGQMFTSMESIAGQAVGAFGAAAAGAFGQADIAKAKFNTALTNIDATAVASRNTNLSNNAAAKAAANNMDDMAGIAMIEYTEDTYISPYPMAVNDLTAITDLANMAIRLEEMEIVVDMMEQAAKTEKRRGVFGIFGTAIQSGARPLRRLFGRR